MKLFFDLNTGFLVTGPGTNERVTALEMKRGDTVGITLQFCRGIVIEELASGSSGKLGVKAAGDYDGDYVAAASGWSKSGSGTSTSYFFELNLNTEELDALLGVGPAPDVPSVVTMFELEFTVGEVVTSSNTVQLTIHNDVNRGSESGPVDIVGGTPNNEQNASWHNTLKTTPLPANGATFTAGGTVYTWRTSAVAAGDVQIGGSAGDCRDSLAAEINGTGNGPPNTFVIAIADGTAGIFLIPLTISGEAGNEITVSVSSTAPWQSTVAPTLDGGVDATAGFLGSMQVDNDFLYVVCSVAGGGVPTWKRIPLEPLE